jgi:hypothetical protein
MIRTTPYINKKEAIESGGEARVICQYIAVLVVTSGTVGGPFSPFRE